MNARRFWIAALAILGLLSLSSGAFAAVPPLPGDVQEFPENPSNYYFLPNLDPHLLHQTTGESGLTQHGDPWLAFEITLTVPTGFTGPLRIWVFDPESWEAAVSGTGPDEDSQGGGWAGTRYWLNKIGGPAPVAIGSFSPVVGVTRGWAALGIPAVAPYAPLEAGTYRFRVGFATGTANDQNGFRLAVGPILSAGQVLKVEFVKTSEVFWPFGGAAIPDYALYFTYVPPETPQAWFRNFDLDAGGYAPGAHVEYIHIPSGSILTGTPSGNNVWAQDTYNGAPYVPEGWWAIRIYPVKTENQWATETSPPLQPPPGGILAPCGHTIGFWKNNIAKQLGVTNPKGFQVPLADIETYLAAIGSRYGGDFSVNAEQAEHILNYEVWDGGAWVSAANDLCVKARAQLLSFMLTTELNDNHDKYIYIPGYILQPLLPESHPAVISYLKTVEDFLEDMVNHYEGGHCAIMPLIDQLNMNANCYVAFYPYF